MSRTAAIVLNWRDAVSSCKCIDSLFQLRANLGIIVVDNDSRDGSFEIIRDHCVKWAFMFDYHIIDESDVKFQKPNSRWLTLVCSKYNGGYAYGNNIGIRLAQTASCCEFFWILNADVTVPSSMTLEHLIQYMDKNEKVGLCGALVCYADDPTRIQTLGGGKINDRGQVSQLGQGLRVDGDINIQSVERDIHYINGACTFVRRRYVEEVGLLNEDYFLYFEELDWAFRGRTRFKLGFCSEAIVLHAVGKSIGTNDEAGRSNLSVYYLNLSRIMFVKDYMDGLLLNVRLEIFLEVIRSLNRRKWSAAFFTLCALLGVPANFLRKMRLL